MPQMLVIIAVVVAVFAAMERLRPGLLHRIEEAILALLLATITLVSFFQVIARYGFSTGWGGALEFTRVTFAWLILFGMSYGMRINTHLGVDAFVRALPPRAFRAMAVFGALCGLLYALIFLYSDWLQVFGAGSRGGAIDYWARMFKAGVGLEDLRFAEWMQSMFGVGDRVPRWVAYLILPVGLALFAFRCIEAAIDIVRGRREMVIAGHEAEDLVAENRDALRE